MEILDKIPEEHRIFYEKGYNMNKRDKCRWHGKAEELKAYNCQMYGDCANYTCNTSCNGNEEGCEYYEK